MRFHASRQILSFNADNASCNDTQTDKLDELDNAFERANRVRCFNHTLQISARGFLEPLAGSRTLGDAADDAADEDDTDGNSLPDLELVGAEDEEEGDVDGVDNEDDAHDNDDAMADLNDEEREELVTNTTAVRDALRKVH